MFKLIFSLLLLLIVKSKTNSMGLNQSSENIFDSACGEIFTQKQFILESKNYPSNYPTDYDCSYLIKGPTCPTYYNFQFLDFNLENSLGCTKDRLEVDKLDALCGNRQGIKSYFASTGTLLVRFVSDESGTGRGYRILVTRLPCGVKNPKEFEETTTKKLTVDDSTSFDIEKFIPTQTTTTVRSYNPDNFPNSNSPKCCSTIYNTKRFIITSPGFPYSLNNPANCVYEIVKNNENVCRLRMHVLFFYFGPENFNNCVGGYLKIDEKVICGCKSDLKLISPFTLNSKILTFKSQGRMKNSYSGFVIEVIQDECPKRYTPEVRSNFKFYNDQVNRISWPNHTTKNEVIERLKLISENTEILDDDDEKEEVARNRTVTNSNPQTVKHIYFFAGRDFDYNFPKDPEETTYIDTSILDNNLPAINELYCLNWNRNQLHLIDKQFGQSLQNCRVKSVSEADCKKLSYVRGYFNSPGYPYYYPGNLNLCYRFKRMEGYCAVRVYFNDFHLENSANCEKDFFIFDTNSRRFCGRNLQNTALTFDLRNRNFHDLHFVTDNFYCGRGFTGLYEQIMCHDPTYPVNPINPNPPTTTNPILPPTTLIPNLPCDRIIQNDLFTLNVYGYNSQRCTFSIKKSNFNVCKLRLYFEKFDLICTSESLVIDGTMYCGHLTGKIVTIDVTNQDPVIIYQKMPNINISGLRLLIRGVQISDDCLYPEVPAERFFQAKKSNFSQTGNSRMDNSSVLVAVDENLCGIIRNITETDSAERFCDLLMRNDNKITKCIPIAEDSLYVPYDNHKLELKINQSEQIQFNEIDCSKMPNL